MKKMAGALSIVMLAGCVSTDPFTGEQKTSNTAKGAGIGALAGAIAGAATAGGNKRTSIVTGAVAGAALGGGVGFYMDKQEAKLRQRLQGSGVQVQREGDNLILIMPGNVTFQTGQYAIKSQFFSVLDSVAEVLAEFDKTAINVAGHTDSQGNAEYNQTLSEQRAMSVKTYLAQSGVATGRIHAVGYGERYPVANNTTASGRQSNRRVELTLEPLQ